MKVLVCILTKKRFEENTKYAIAQNLKFVLAQTLVISLDEDLEIENTDRLAVETKNQYTIAQAKRYALEYAKERQIEYVCYYPVNTITSDNSNWVVNLLFAHKNHFSPGVVGVLNQDTEYDCVFYPCNEYENSLINVTENNVVEGLYILPTQIALNINCFEEDYKGYTDYYVSKLFQLYGYHNFYCTDEFCFKYSIQDDIEPIKDSDSFEKYKTAIAQKIKNIGK
jgi:hypothetical protein